MGQQNINLPSEGSSSQMGTGMIIGLLLALVVLGFVVWYFFLNGNGGGAPLPSPGDGSTVPSVLISSFLN